MIRLLGFLKGAARLLGVFLLFFLRLPLLLLEAWRHHWAVNGALWLPVQKEGFVVRASLVSIIPLDREGKQSVAFVFDQYNGFSRFEMIAGLRFCGGQIDVSAQMGRVVLQHKSGRMYAKREDGVLWVADLPGRLAQQHYLIPDAPALKMEG